LDNIKPGPRLPQVRFIVNQIPTTPFVNQNSGFLIHNGRALVLQVELLHFLLKPTSFGRELRKEAAPGSMIYRR